MKKLLLLLLIFCSQISFSQKKVIDTITSQKLKGDREIIIGLPPSYDKNKSQTYPMLLLFDGDFLFDAFNGALSYGYYWDDLPEVIIVGISQTKMMKEKPIAKQMKPMVYQLKQVKISLNS